MDLNKYFASAVEEHAKNIPDRIAVNDNGRYTKTWKELADDVTRVSNSFLNLGLKKGDSIATLLKPGYGFHVVFMAASTVGLTVVPLDMRFKANEAAELCNRTNPRILISSAFPVNDVVKDYDKFEYIYAYEDEIDYPGALPYEKLLEGSLTPIPEELKGSADDPLIIVFTSGTTGMPKGAMITNRNCWWISKNAAETWEFTHDDIVCNYLPTSHCACVNDEITLAIFAGCTSFCMPGFDPLEVIKAIEKQRITYILTIPTVFRLLMLNVDMKKFDLTSMRALILSGESVSAELASVVNDYFPNTHVISSWGMSETAGYFTLTKPSDPLEIVCTTEGSPKGYNMMRPLKDDGAWAKIGELGELCITGPQVVPGYMDKEHTEATFFEKDGARWMKTGDTGYMDESGYMHFVGRCKEMYISGGYNVYPPEIEAYLGKHEKINAAAVVGVSDPVWGEVGYAFIQPEKDIELTAEEVNIYCKEGLADYKRPKKVFIRTDIPKTAIGKIEKKTINNNIDFYTS